MVLCGVVSEFDVFCFGSGFAIAIWKCCFTGSSVGSCSDFTIFIISISNAINLGTRLSDLPLIC